MPCRPERPAKRPSPPGHPARPGPCHRRSEHAPPPPLASESDQRISDHGRPLAAGEGSAARARLPPHQIGGPGSAGPARPRAAGPSSCSSASAPAPPAASESTPRVPGGPGPRAGAAGVRVVPAARRGLRQPTHGPVSGLPAARRARHTRRVGWRGRAGAAGARRADFLRILQPEFNKRCFCSHDYLSFLSRPPFLVYQRLTRGAPAKPAEM
jgi:hypothetical protein